MLSERAVQNLVDYWAERIPDAEMVFDGTRRVSWGEMKDMVDRLVSALHMMGVGKGDRVMAATPSWAEYWAVCFSLCKLNAALIPCVVGTSKDELTRRAQDTKPKVIFSGCEDLVIEPSAESAHQTVTVRFQREGLPSFDSLLADAEVVDVGIEPNSPAGVFAVLTTSGTTGAPKYVEQTYQMVEFCAANMSQRLDYTPEDTVLLATPATAGLGLVSGVFVPAFGGCKVVSMERFKANDALDLIDSECVTAIVGVPTVYQRILDAFVEAGRPAGRIRCLKKGMVAGALCSEALLRRVDGELGLRLAINYGSTEAGPISMASVHDDLEHRATTSGRLYDGITGRVVDDEGNKVPPGTIGELIVSSASTMKGYAAGTGAGIKREGNEVRTGDLVSIDAEGYLTNFGRKDDMLIRGGFNIYPQEIANLYRNHPAVCHVEVFGIKDDELGVRTVAAIQLIEGARETCKALREWAIGKIAKYKVPDRILVVDVMPHAPNGKVDRKELRRLADAAFVS